VQVYYDSKQVTFPELLQVFFARIDPTQVSADIPLCRV
jgi:peptide methionine sulfoxide reductase MsrA